jgi:type IV pilus assembly protein PilV
MYLMPLHCASKSGRQRGVSLLESLVALSILAIAILGLLAVQWRTLAHAGHSLRRAQAVQLAADLAGRLRSNPIARAQLNAYASSWGVRPAAPAKACDQAACNAVELARWDIARWRASVADTLPQGDAATFVLSSQTGPARPRQLGVMVGWRQSSEPADDDSPAARRLLQPATGSAATDCPSRLHCHLVHVQP